MTQMGGYAASGSFSALASLVARLDLVDHIDLAATANNLARRVTLLRGFDRGNDFHKRFKTPVIGVRVNSIVGSNSVLLNSRRCRQLAYKGTVNPSADLSRSQISKHPRYGILQAAQSNGLMKPCNL